MSYDRRVTAPAALFDEKWIVERELGSGGMGRVFRARHAKLDGVVAIKTIHAHLAADSTIVRRFEREARAASALRSRHVVAILEIARLPSGLPYIVMEHLDGKDLDTIRVERGALPIREVVAWTLEACEGIGDAHRAGIVHRDLKPQNLLLANQAEGPPIVKVLDFGLAKALPGGALRVSSDTATAAGGVIGTPFFMSPEQVRSLPTIDGRTDVWSLGATLYELIAGRPPFTAPNLHLLRARILREDPPPLRTFRPEASTELADIVARCMRRDPAARFATMEELASALRSAPLPASESATDTIDEGLTEDTARGPFGDTRRWPPG